MESRGTKPKQNVAQVSETGIGRQAGFFQTLTLALERDLITEAVKAKRRPLRFTFGRLRKGHLDTASGGSADHAPPAGGLTLYAFFRENDRRTCSQTRPGQIQRLVAHAKSDQDASAQPGFIVVDDQIDERGTGGNSGSRGATFHLMQGFLFFSLGFQFQQMAQTLKVLINRWI